MSDTRWDMRNIKDLLIKHQQEYIHKGLESGLDPESDGIFYSTWIHHRIRMLSLIPVECRRLGTKVLDLGGGKGRMAVMLRELGLEATIVDTLYSDRSLLNLAGEPLVPVLESYLRGKGIQVVSQDFYENGIPFPDETFKLVIFSEVLEHLPNSPKPVLMEIRRILAPGGWLILTTPNLVSMSNRKRFLLGHPARERVEDFYEGEVHPEASIYDRHNREYTREEVEYMLGQENFTVVRSTTCDYRGPNSSYSLVKRLFLYLIDGIRYLPKKFSSDLSNFIVILARR